MATTTSSSPPFKKAKTPAQGTPAKIKARLPKGVQDLSGATLDAQRALVESIEGVYQRYGFMPLETSILEYAEALGKYLPDQDRPNAGVFSFQDSNEQWLALRYDLTAPLARYVAQQGQHLPRPFRRYQVGSVFRNEKPDPGRFRQFTQLDADTVGSSSLASDAEMCALAVDCMEALPWRQVRAMVRLNNRKILDGLLEGAGLTPLMPSYKTRRLQVLRAIDKWDRLGVTGVVALLGQGRADSSGDFTAGAGLTEPQQDIVRDFLAIKGETRREVLAGLRRLAQKMPGDTSKAMAGLGELETMDAYLTALHLDSSKVMVDTSVVRGLDYYTGPVFEVTLVSEEKSVARLGSVGGGGRYDDLLEKFGQGCVPCVGLSIGISRLAAIFAEQDHNKPKNSPLVVVAVLDKQPCNDDLRMVQELRKAGICAEVYLGKSGLRGQMKYADRRGAAVVVLAGADERAAQQVMIKDLLAGAQRAQQVTDNAAWRQGGQEQHLVPRATMVAQVQNVLCSQQCSQQRSQQPQQD